MESYSLKECCGTQARPRRTCTFEAGVRTFEEYQMMKYYRSLPRERFEKHVQFISTFKEALRSNERTEVFHTKIFSKSEELNQDDSEYIEAMIRFEISEYCNRYNIARPNDWREFLNNFDFIDTDYDDELDEGAFSYIVRSNHISGTGITAILDSVVYPPITDSDVERVCDALNDATTQDDSSDGDVESKMDEGVGVTPLIDEANKPEEKEEESDNPFEVDEGSTDEDLPDTSDDEVNDLPKVPTKMAGMDMVKDIMDTLKEELLNAIEPGSASTFEYIARMLNVIISCFYLFTETKSSLVLRLQNVFNTLENFVWFNTGSSLVDLVKRIAQVVSVYKTASGFWNKITGKSLDTLSDILNVAETCDAMKCVKDILHFSLISRFFTDNRMVHMIFGRVTSKEYTDLTLVTVLRSTVELIKMLKSSTSELISSGTIDPKLLYSEGRSVEFLKEVPIILSSDITVENIESLSHRVLEYKQLYDKVYFDVVATNNNALIGRVAHLYSSLLAKENEILEILNGQVIDIAPYVYVVNATSSVGKTMCVDYFSDVIKTALGIDITKPSTYMVQNIPGKAWMPNFHEFTGAECRFDDFQQFKNNMENMTTFLNMTGNLVTFAPQPEADKMGKHKVKPQLISVTSNVADPSLGKKFCFADEYWKCMPAFIRRFQHIVCLSLKKEFTAPNGELDKNKCNALPAGVMADAWLVTIHAPKLHPLKNSEKSFEQEVTFEVVLKEGTIFEAAKYLKARAIEHRDQQKRMLEKLREGKQPQFFSECAKGHLPGEPAAANCDFCLAREIRGRSWEKFSKLPSDIIQSIGEYVPRIGDQVSYPVRWSQILDPRCYISNEYQRYILPPFARRNTQRSVLLRLYHRRHYIMLKNKIRFIHKFPKTSERLVNVQEFFIQLAGWFRGRDSVMVDAMIADGRQNYTWVFGIDPVQHVRILNQTIANIAILTVATTLLAKFVLYMITPTKPSKKKKKEKTEIYAKGDIETLVAQDAPIFEKRYQLSSFTDSTDIRNLALCASKLPNNPEQWWSTMQHSVYAITLTQNKRKRTNIAIYFQGHVCVTVKHMFHDVDLSSGGSITLEFESIIANNYNRNHTETLFGANFYFDDERDLVYIRTTKFKHPNRLHLLPDSKLLAQPYEGSSTCYRCSAGEDKFIQREQVMIRRYHGELNYRITNSVKMMSTKDAMRGKMPCDGGNCGSPLVSNDLIKTYMLGIVIAASDTESYYQEVSREAYKRAVGKLNKQCNFLGTSRSLDTPIFLKNYEPKLNVKSEFNYVDEQVTLDVMGFTVNKRGPQKPTMVVDSLINPVGEIEHCGPVLNHGWHHGFPGYYKPYWEMIKLSTNPPDVPFGPLVVCMKDLLDTIRSRISITVFEETVMKLTIEQAVFGVDGVAYINKIKDQSSSGDPYYVPNGQFYDLETHWIDVRIVKQVALLREKAITTEDSAMVTFNVLLKDEVVKESKRFKPRVFTGGSLSFLILAKQYFGAIARVVMTRRFDFETAQGLNTESPEWKDLYNLLTLFGLDTLVAGDFEKFDKKVLKVSLRLAFNVLIELIRDSGNFDENDFKVMDFIMDGICDAAFILYGTLFMLPCSEPSGHFLTTVINGFVTSMYIRLTYLLEFGEVDTFRYKVNLISVGDDHIFGTSEKKFGFVIVKKWLDKFGIGYTGNDKHGPDPPNQDHIDNCSFLKRRFTYEQYPMNRGIMCAPIELSTISKLLNMFVRSKAMSMYEQTLECIENAMVFLAHHPPDVYYEWQRVISDRCEARSVTFQKRTYEEMWDSIATRRAYRREVVTNNITSKTLEVDTRRVLAKAMKYSTMATNTSIKEDDTSKNTPISTGSSQQNTIFVDDASMVKKTFVKGSQAGLLCSVQPMAELADFFRRPIQLQSIEWTGAHNDFDKIANFNPWSLWMTHPTVKNKLQTYRNFRGDLHMRIMINSNKFLYGTIAVYYEPLQGISTYQIRNRYTSASQLPGVRLGSSHNYTQQMHLPFVFITDWFDLTTAASDSRTIGEVTVQVINYLRSVSALTDANDKVEISVWVWAEDVQLSGLTACDIFSQSSEMEEADGIISGPASAVANVSGKVADMMGDGLIGRLARSTEIGSRAVSRIAQLAGFSRPPNIKGLSVMKQHPFSSLSFTVGGDTVQKLTVDPQQELTVDGTYCGLSNDDDMSLSCVAQTESFIGTFQFSTVHGSGADIMKVPVRPNLPTHVLSVNSDSPMELPAITFASIPFTWWRGSIDYRFEVVATPFHKGRLRVVYEPTSTYAGSYDYNRNFQHVVDISETHDFTVRVEWSQMEHWRRTGDPLAFTTGANTNRFGIDNAVSLLSEDNGMLSVIVVNELSVPDRTLNFTINPVIINVYIKAGPDFELAVPDMALLKEFQAFPKASASSEVVSMTMEDTLEPDKQIVQDGDDCCESPSSGPTPDAHLVYMGEAVHSIRALCKRYTYFFAARLEELGTAAGTECISTRMWRYPLLPGDSPNGVMLNGATQTNKVGWSFASWYGIGYAVERGGMRYKMLFNRGSSNITGRVTRRTYAVGSGYGGANWYQAGRDEEFLLTDSNYVLNEKALNVWYDTGDGTMIVDYNSQPGVEYEIPFQSNVRFRAAVDRDQTMNSNLSLSSDIFDNVARLQIFAYINAPAENTILRQQYTYFTAAGEDFSLHWFLGPATVWWY